MIIEHHGVKGQKWGLRKNPDAAGFGSRSKKQKAALIGVSVGSYLLGSGVVGRLTMNAPLSIAAGAASGIIGARIAKNLLDDQGDTRVSEIKK